VQEVKEITIQDVINKRKEHSRKIDTKLIMKAYNYANKNHGDQCRRSGEPYIIHPLNVAYILADIGLDDSTISAALLHDLVEDTDVTDKDIKQEFGLEIAEMVEGVTKLGSMQFASIEEQQVEDYRKMFLAMGKDIRVIIIKLADRLHNMRTLKYLKRDRQIANAKETMELYAPLANRLGLYSIKWELEDLGFKYLYPEEYHELVEGINKKREERLKFIEKIMGDIRVELKKEKIEAEVTRKSKTLI
jgi:GTP pyrophosphokinase